MQKYMAPIIYSIIFFLVLFMLCIYPSFVTKHGVDCIAGCVEGKGFPIAFKEIHRSYTQDFGSSKINLLNLLMNYAFLAVIATIPIGYAIIKKRTAILRAALYLGFALMLSFIIGLPLLFMYLSAESKAGAKLTDSPVSPPAKLCIADVKQCSDGSYVGRIGPKCEFALCPNSSPTTTNVSPSYLPKTVTLKDGTMKVTSMYGYTVTAPPNWYIRNDNEDQVEFKLQHCIYGKNECLEQVSSITFSLLLPNPNNLSAYEWAEMYRSDLALSKSDSYGVYARESYHRSDYKIAGASGLLIKPETSQYHIVILPYKGKILEIDHSYVTGHSEYKEELSNDLKKILNTFTM